MLTILALYSASFARAQQTVTAPQGPIRIELSQKADAPPSWEKWITLAEKIAWPVVAILCIILLREDVLTFRTEDATMILSSSAKRSLFTMFEQPGKFEFVAINLGRGQSWLSSRLFIFAIMLQRLKSLRCIVFLCAGPDTETQFLGASTPQKVRWGLAMFQPWLENAYVEACQSPVVGPLAIQNENGALDPNQAEQIVKGFLNVLIKPPVPPAVRNEWEWVALAPNQQPEHATWLSKEYLQALDHIFWKDVIVASNNKDEVRALLKCSAPLVARVKRNREFISLIDRVSFLDEAMNKISDKLEAKE